MSCWRPFGDAVQICCQSSLRNDCAWSRCSSAHARSPAPGRRSVPAPTEGLVLEGSDALAELGHP
eukprot:13545247-Alexandrium_andersonii.AAC.1